MRPLSVLAPPSRVCRALGSKRGIIVINDEAYLEVPLPDAAGILAILQRTLSDFGDAFPDDPPPVRPSSS